MTGKSLAVHHKLDKLGDSGIFRLISMRETTETTKRIKNKGGSGGKKK
jgi:hypothetical protein